MEVLIQYPTEILTWNHDHFMKFIGSNTEDITYSLGLTANDPTESKCCHCKVDVESKTENSGNGIVFCGKTSTVFKILHNNEVPQVEFFFNLIDKATFEFAKIFHEKTQQTNLVGHKIEIPQIENLREYIQKCVGTWDKTIRNTSLN